MAEGRFVAYYRVSTARQGRSGLGLEAQQETVRSYLNGGAWRLLAEFTEIESGKRSDRPELERALAHCRLTGAVLVIAKLDRLSRDLAFLANLMKAGTEFVACDNPHATKFTVHILAAVAEHEREMISRRTRDALAAAKARGTKLGGWRGGPVQDPTRATQALMARADEYAARVRPIAAGLRVQGNSLRAIATEMAARGIRTPRGAAWTPTGVRNLLNRQGAAA